MTIDRFNKLTGHETLHPLICMVDFSKANLTEDIRMTCNFYGLLYYNDSECCFIPICYATHRLKTVSRPTRNAAAVRGHCRSTKGES